MTFVQCIFVVGGTAQAEDAGYRELVSDYFSFNAPTRIAACGEDFALFDSGRVHLFCGGAHSFFDTDLEQCDKLVLSEEGVFLLVITENSSQILCYSFDGSAKNYVIPSDNVTDITYANGKLYTIANLLNVKGYGVLDGAPKEEYSLPSMSFAPSFAADVEVTYFRKYDGTIIRKTGGDFAFLEKIGEADALAAHGGNLYYAKEGTINVFGESASFLPKVNTGESGDASFAEVTDLAVGDKIFVLDGENKAVKVYDLNGKYERMIGAGGRDVGRLTSPVALAAKQGKVIVADSLRGSEFGESVRSLKGRNVLSPTDVAMTSDAVYLADKGTLYEYNSALVFVKDYSVGTSACKYVTASAGGTVYASSGKDVYVKKGSAFVKLFTSDREITGMNVGFGENILYLLSGSRISVYYTENNEVIATLDTALAVKGFAVDCRGNIYVVAEGKIHRYERVLTGFSEAEVYDLPQNYAAYSDVALSEAGELYVIADHNVLVYPGQTFSVATDVVFEDNEPSVDPRFVCSVVKDNAIAYVSPGNFENIMIVPKGTFMMCYATVEYKGASYVRAQEPKKGTTIYLPVEDVKVYASGAAPFAKARCLIAAIGNNVVGVDIYEEPSKLPGAKVLFHALGQEDVFDVLSVVAVDEAGKSVWGFYRVSYQGQIGYVRDDEVVSVDAEAQPMPKTVEMQVKSDGLGHTVIVYKAADLGSEQLATLADGSTIKVVDPFDPESEFSLVIYNNEYGYVLSRNLGERGLSAGQVLAIVLSVVAAVGSVLTILILRANKRHKRRQKE